MKSLLPLLLLALPATFRGEETATSEVSRDPEASGEVLRPSVWREELRAWASRGAPGPVPQQETRWQQLSLLLSSRHLTHLKDRKEKGEYLAWLLARPELLGPFVQGLEETRSPEDYCYIFDQLRKQYPDRIEKFTGLAIAFSRHWSEYLGRPYLGIRKFILKQRQDPEPPPPAWKDLEKFFAYYLDLAEGGKSGKKLPLDFSALPWRLLLQVVDSDIAVEERAWAREHYLEKHDPHALFEDTPFDQAAFAKGKPKKNLGHPYTLPNLKMYGGLCLDQAYFTLQVLKSLGIPSAIFTTQGKNGLLHAWVGYLKEAFGNYTWDMTVGRYRVMQYYHGRIMFPAAGTAGSDHELAFYTKHFNLPAEKRQEAELYQGIWTVLHRTLDPKNPGLLLDKALDASSFHQQSWEALIWLAGSGKMDRETLKKTCAGFFRPRLLEEGPDALFHLLASSWPAWLQQPTLAREQVKNLLRSCSLRPDLGLELFGMLLALEKSPSPEVLLKKYVKEFLASFKYPPIAFALLQKIEALRPAREDLKALYSRFSGTLEKPEECAEDFSTQTFHSQLQVRMNKIEDKSEP